MNKLILALALVMATVSFTSTAQASNWFGGGNNGEWKMGPNGPYWDKSDWPSCTPMYRMEKFMDFFDDDYVYGGGYGMPQGGYGMSPYGGSYNQAPYGYGMPRSDYGYPNMPVMPAIPVQ